MVNDNIWITDWKNEHMNSKMAQMLSAKLRKMDAPLQKVAGWNCGSYSSLGLDVDKHYQDNDGLIDCGGADPDCDDNFACIRKDLGSAIKEYCQFLNISSTYSFEITEFFGLSSTFLKIGLGTTFTINLTPNGPSCELILTPENQPLA